MIGQTLDLVHFQKSLRSSAVCAVAMSVMLSTAPTIAESTSEPLPGALMTRWAQDVSPENVLPEYPRPQMRRENWRNLNGVWDYAVGPRESQSASDFEGGTILVPFPIESALSGVKKRVGKDNMLWYRRNFEVPAAWAGQRVLLHFGAVDWESTVWVNGVRVGDHRGGFDAFYFDITDALAEGSEQQLMVRVWDPTDDDATQPRGKQVTKPRGIWYTAVTGIWQTVWLEAVPATSIAELQIVPDVDSSSVRVTVEGRGAQDGDSATVTVMHEGKVVGNANGSLGDAITVTLENPSLWSPDAPFLYDLTVALERNEEMVDRVESYFGMRKIAMQKDEAGVNRLFLNNEVLFQFGPLDQGWWPDGLYTAPTDEALAYDVAVTKRMGFNMIRKHVKIEPARWYYHCDRLGMLVWQDMPGGGGGRDDDVRPPAEAERYNRELKAMIDTHRNHPSIVMWVPFNEGWGQFDTARVSNWVKDYDPTRLVNPASGWHDRGVGDVHDIHKYPGPDMADLEDKRAIVLGEFGGLGLPMNGHTWIEMGEANWGYRNFEDVDALTDAYRALLEKLEVHVAEGLAAAVYTQTTDVETEVNGLMTYDRAIVKIGEEKLAEMNNRLYVVPTNAPRD